MGGVQLNDRASGGALEPPPAPLRETRSRRRRVWWFLLAFIACQALAAGASVQFLESWMRSERVLPQPIEIELQRGQSLEALSAELEAKGLIRAQLPFWIWVRIKEVYPRFQAGLYRFEGRIAPIEVVRKMLSGEVYVPIVLQLTVREGATLREVADRLVRAGIGKQEAILEAARDSELLERLKVPSASLEGFLYPATYPYSKVPSVERVFGDMVAAFWRALPADYEQRVQAMGLSLAQAVTFASLIELETARDDEREIIAEVIWNRLRRGLPLGIDAAIIYGIQDYRGDITFKHLRDSSNPYNTRIHAGLPPTPVGSPSLKSLLAVLNPTSHGYLYYVVDAENPGIHRFARTLKEHNQNVRDYLRAHRKRRSP